MSGELRHPILRAACNWFLGLPPRPLPYRHAIVFPWIDEENHVFKTPYLTMRIGDGPPFDETHPQAVACAEVIDNGRGGVNGCRHGNRLRITRHHSESEHILSIEPFVSAFGYWLSEEEHRSTIRGLLGSV